MGAMSFVKVGPRGSVEESAGRPINSVIQRARNVCSFRISFPPQRNGRPVFFCPAALFRCSVPDSDLQTPIRELVIEFRASKNALRKSKHLCYSNFEFLTMTQFRVSRFPLAKALDMQSVSVALYVSAADSDNLAMSDTPFR